MLFGHKLAIDGTANLTSHIIYHIGLGINGVCYLLIGVFLLLGVKNRLQQLKAILMFGCGIGIGLLFFPTGSVNHQIGSYEGCSTNLLKVLRVFFQDRFPNLI